MRRGIFSLLLLVTLVMGLCLPAQAQQVVGTWLSTSSGSWSVGTNWVSGTVPGSHVGDTANLAANITATTTVTLDQNETVGTLKIGDLDETNKYTLAPAAAQILTLDNGGNAATANLTQFGTSGGDTLSVPLSLNSNLLLSNLAGGSSGGGNAQTLTLSGAINGTSGQLITINPIGAITFSGSLGSNVGGISIGGGAQTVTFSAANAFTGPLSVATGTTVVLSAANSYTGGTTINGGLVKVGNSGSLGTGPLVINGGVLDATATVTVTPSSQTWNSNWTFNATSNLNLGSGPVTLGTNVVVGANSNNTLTVGGVIGDGGHGYGLTVTSAYNGNAILSGYNTYGGPTTLLGAWGADGGGTITLMGSNATSGITVTNVTLALGISGSGAANPAALGTGMLTIMPHSTISYPFNGAVNLSTNNNQTWAGDFTFSTLAASTNAALNFGSGTVTLTGNRTVCSQFNNPVTVGSISDGGNNYSLTTQGNLNLHITRASTYTGGTFLNGTNPGPGANGNLNLDFNASGAPSTNLLAPTGPLTMTGADLIINGGPSGTATSQTLGGFSFNGTNYVRINQNGSSSATLALPNTWTRGPGGAVVFSLSGASAFVSSQPIASVSAQTSSTPVLPYAFVNDSTSSTYGFATVVNNNVVRYNAATTLAASTGNSPATNYMCTGGSLALGGATSVNSLSLNGTTVDLGGNTLSLTSGGLMNFGASTVQDGTLTAGTAGELIVANFNNTFTVSASISGNAALTTAGLNAITISGPVSNTPTINFNSTATTNLTGLITNVNTINFGATVNQVTIGAMGTAAAPLGNAVTVNSLAEPQNGPVFSGALTGNGSTAVTINNNLAYAAQNGGPIFTFSGGLTGVSTLSVNTPNANIMLMGNTATTNGSLLINGTTAVTGLSAVNLSNYALSTISAPLVLGNNFKVTETNAGYLAISSSSVIGNGSTAISFRGPNAFQSGGVNPNTISGGTIGDGTAGHAVALISNDGGELLTISSAINSGSSANLELINTSIGLLKVTGQITANNLVIVGGNGMHAASHDTGGLYSVGVGNPGISAQDMVDLSPAAANVLSGSTSVTDAALLIDNSSNALTKISTGALSLSSAALVVSNGTSANPSVASTTIGAGQSQVELWNGSGVLALGTVSNSNFGTVNFFTKGTSGNAGVQVGNTPTNSLIGGWATYGTDFAAVGTLNGKTVVSTPGTNGVTAYTALSASGSGMGSTINAQYLASASLTTTIPITANTLQITNNGGNTTLDQTIALGANNLMLASGGLLFFNSNYVNNTSTGGGGTTITGTGGATIYGDTGAGNSPLYVTVDPAATSTYVNQSLLTIAASVVGNGSGTLVKAGYGELIVTAAAGYTGGTVINGGILRADNNALSGGPLVLNSAGAYATSGTFSRAIGAGSGQVSFGPGGGGFSAEGGNLIVNLGGAGAPVDAGQLGGNLVLGSQVYSTGALNFQNPITMNNEALTITTATVPDESISGTQSNLGTAYAKLSGGISGTGSLTIYGVGWHGNVGSNLNVALADGMVAVPGGINVNGPITLFGGSLYVPSMAALANNNVLLTNGGVIATSGTANITFGAAAGQVQFSGVGWSGGFAAVGGPLVVRANNNEAWELCATDGTTLLFGPNSVITLGSAFSTHAVDYQSPVELAATSFYLNVAGPVPNIMSGQIIGGGSTVTFGVYGNGIAVVSNSSNNFTGSVSVGAGAMLRPTSSGALGNTAAGTSYNLTGTLDLNGNSFSGRNWGDVGQPGSAGPLALPCLINTNTASTATFGSAADSYYLSNNASGAAVGGPGNITLPGKFVGGLVNGGTFVFKGTGTVTISGDSNGVTYGGAANQTYKEQVNGMTMVWDYSTDTGSKTLVGASTGSIAAPTTTSQQNFYVNQAALQLKGNAGTAVTQNLPMIGGDYLNSASAGASSVGQVGLYLNGGFNSVNLTTAGQNLTLAAGDILRNPSSVYSSVDFSTNTTAGGTAGINFGASGLGIALSTAGGGYSLNSNIPFTVASPTSGGVAAIGHAATNGSGVITAVYMDNWGSGFTGNTVNFSIPGGTGTATLYFNNPTTGIIGGYATYSGADWAYRDTSGNIQPLPAGSYASDPGSTWTASTNVSLDAAGLASGLSSGLTVATLRITAAAPSSNTLTIASGQTLSLGYNTSNITQPGGIMVTSAVGTNNITITGGNIQNGCGNDALFIHQNNPGGTLTITSNINNNGNNGLVKDGAGTLILTGTSAYTQGTYIYAGTLEVPWVANNGTNSPLGNGNVTVQGGATFQVNTLSSTASTATNRLITLGIGGGVLDASGSGAVVFNGAANTKVNTDYYTEAVAGDGYSNFTLAGNGNGVMNGSILLLTPPQSTGNYGGNNANGAASVVEGFTQVTKTGAGTWTLNNYNYWQGGTIINQGTLVLNLSPSANYLPGPATSGVNVVTNVNYADAISENAPVEIDTGGTLQLNYPEVTGQVNLYGGSITGTGALWGRAYNFQAGTVSASVPLVGDFSLLTKSTTGTITLSGSNTYAAGTVLNAGTININNAGNATSSAIGTGPLTLNGGSFDNTSGTIALATNNAQNWNGSFTFLGSTSLSDSGAVTLGGNPTVTVSGNTLTVGSIGDGGQGYGFTKAGSGTLTLTAPATYSGATTVNGGVLALIASNLLSASSNVYVGANSSAGTLDVTAGVQTVNSLTIGSLGALNESMGNPLTINGAVSLASSSTLNMSGAIVTPELLMTYGAAGLTGSFSNIFTNGNPLPRNEVLSYSGGSVEVISIALPFTGSGVWVSNSGATWNNSANWLDAYSVSGVPGDGTRPGNTDTATFSGSGTIAGTITLDTTASINLAALSFSTSNYTLSGGSLTLQQGTTGSGTATVTVTSGSQAIQSLVQIAGGNLAIALSNSGILAISGNISDDNLQRSLTLAGDGSGRLVLSGMNSYGGATNVNAGAMYITNFSALPPESNLTVGAGGTFIFDPNGPAASVATSSPASAGAIAAVPEPGTLALLAVGLVVGFGIWRRKKGIWELGVRSRAFY